MPSLTMAIQTKAKYKPSRQLFFQYQNHILLRYLLVMKILILNNPLEEINVINKI